MVVINYLKLKGSKRKHQLPQVHLQLPKRTGQLPSRKNKAFWDLIACDMIHSRLLLHNWLYECRLLLQIQFEKTVA